MTTRDQALTLLSNAIQAKDYATADVFFDYIAWLDSQKA
jgi:hypothetical protein